MTTAWAHLPNAAHIDWVLADATTNPDKWSAAWGAAWDAARDAAWDAAWDAVWDAARGAAWDAARGAAWDAAQGAARGVARGAAWGAAWDAARDAAAALIAWDDCAPLLDLPVDAVKTLAACGHHAAVLLLPAVTVRQTNRA